MTNRKNISLASLAASAAVAVLAFGLATPAAHAQVGFGISVGSPGYVDNGYAPGAGYVYQQGYWAPDPDGDGHVRWVPGGWVASPYQGGYYGGAYATQYQGGYYGRRDDDHEGYRRDDRRYSGYGYRRHDDDDER